MDLLKTIFVILILFAFPLGEISRINFQNGIAFTFLDIGIFFLVIFWLFGHILKRKEFNYDQFLPAILFFIFPAILSLLVNFNTLNFSNFLVPSLYLIRWIFYALVLFITAEFDNKFKQKISVLMLISGFLIIIGGFVQYFFYPNLRNLYYAGWDEHLYRLFSSFLDPNFVGAFLALYLLFVLNLFFESKDRAQFTILILLSFLAIILTFSRAAFIMLFVGVLVLSLLKNQRRFATGFFIVSILFLILLLKFPLKSEGTNLLRIASGQARFDSIKNAIIIFKDHPIFGVGFNAYRYAQKRYNFIDKNWQLIHSGAGTDNSFLFVLATTGIIGFFAYLYMWIKIVKFSKSDIFISSLLALFVNSLFVNSLFYTFIIFWIWILLGIRKST